jgi:hypothetical protein
LFLGRRVFIACSEPTGQVPEMNLPVARAAILAACLCSSARADPPPPNVCFSTTEAREKIAAHGLTDPFRLVRGATRAVTADIVAVKLCLWSDRLVYEISLLPRDGHVGRILIDARTGERIVPRD